MREPKREAGRWLKQAGHDLKLASSIYRQKYFSDVCFLCEQAAQKLLKAYLYARGVRFITIHSIRSLIRACARHDKAFERLSEKAKVLDKYYIPTRYPDALAPPAVPFESYTKKEAREALAYTREFYTFVSRKLR